MRLALHRLRVERVLDLAAEFVDCCWVASSWARAAAMEKTED